MSNENPELRRYAEIYDCWKEGKSAEETAELTGRDLEYVRYSFAKYQAKEEGTWKEHE